MNDKVLLFILLGLITNIFAYVKEITDISNGFMFTEYDIYSQAVLKYENRIIARSLYKITEYEIMEDGMLSESHIHETKNGAYGFSFIDGDRYYYVDRVNYIYSSPYHIIVYDLSQSPMEKITTVYTSVSSQERVSFYFSETHMMITDPSNKRVVCINKDNYNIDSYIEGDENHLYAGITMIKGSYLVQGLDSGVISHIRFFYINDLLNDVLDLSYELELPKSASSGLTKLQIQEDFLIVSHFNGVIIIDISDIHHPVIIHDLVTGTTVSDAIYVEDKIIVSYEWTNYFEVFQYQGNGNYEQIHFKTKPTPFGQDSCILLVTNFLYWHNEAGLNVYDITDDFSQLYSYGRFSNLHSYIPHDSDIYFIENNQAAHLVEIISILDNNLKVAIDFEHPTAINSLQIKEDLLYLTKTERINNVWQNAFDIYRIENKKAHHLSTLSFGDTLGGRFYVGESRVFIDLWMSNRIRIYDINENYELVNMTEYPGTLQLAATNFPKEYILSYNGNNVTLRSQNNFENVIASGNIPMTDRGLWYYGKNYFFVSSMLDNRFTLYNYDTENGNISLKYDFPLSPESTILPFNEIITKNATHSEKSIYYTIIDGQITQIGEKYDERAVRETYFYPERKKMVQIAGSGIWVYDVDYELSDTDVLAEVRSTGLMGNYPNPFNPETTIKFRIENSELKNNTSLSFGESRGEGFQHVRIDIFNIKGQKVRALVDRVYPSGEHSVVWNGTDDSGVSVGSGIYLYRMSAGSVTETKKMVLLK